VDTALWDSLASGRGLVPRLAPTGPLIDQGSARAIEVWTESELSALHALSWLGVAPGGEELFGRALTAAAWHVEHTQPDNATQRPWSVQVFAALAARDGNADAGVFAETLLHSCQVSMGRADILSRHILSDAADWIGFVCGGEA